MIGPGGMTICVDFDGTCVDHRYPDMGQDVPGAVKTLKELIGAGHELVLWSVRSGESLAAAVKWFRDRDIFLSGINENPGQSSWSTSRKAYAHLYIDDSAFGAPLIFPAGFKHQVIDWERVSSELLGLKTSLEIVERKS